MNSALLNRILLVLGIIGVYIAGSLTYQHLGQVEIPCGGASDCSTVARHPSSYINFGFGQPVPVAVIGLLGYIGLSALALVRSLTNRITSQRLVGAGYLMAGIGTAYSLYLQYLSFTLIGAKCKWCIGSALLMMVTFVVYIIYFSKVSAMKDPEAEKAGMKGDLLVGGIGPLVALAAIFMTFRGSVSANLSIETVKVANVEDLIPAKRNQLGNDSAKVTVVEFADLCCPTCRRSFPKLKELYAKYPENIRVIYRHFPLFQIPGHEQSALASVTAEVAADQGKFWEFAAAFTEPDEAAKTEEEVFSIAKSVGLDPGKINAVRDKEDDPTRARVFTDRAYGIQIGINMTPTYVLYIPGQEAKKMDWAGVESYLQKPEVAALLK